jgi:RHS repeat-associated protein
LFQYLYDGEGRICAVKNLTVGSMTGYLYDAEGNRIAKGSITTMSCDPSANGFSSTNDFLLGPGGEQVTEMAVEGDNTLTWYHTNVWAAGRLIATYDNDGLHFYFDDPRGSRRIQTDQVGNIEQTCANLPFGDGETCSAIPTEHLFTGKERDAESGNDYFGARYYASTMGRFMSPDWSAQAEPVPYAKLDDPQSLNLYSYVRNNPLARTDQDGHCCESDFDSFQTPEQKNWGGGATEVDRQFGQMFKGILEIGAAAIAGPEVLAGAASTTTLVGGLGVGVAAVGTTGAAVNGVKDVIGGATHTDVDAATNAVTAVTNPIAGAVSLATGSTEKGSQASDLKLSDRLLLTWFVERGSQTQLKW